MNQLQVYELQETSYVMLLDKALYAKMITKQMYLERQRQIEQKVGSLVHEYHRGRSSSISLPLYRRFLKSVLFTLDHALSTTEQIAFLKTTTIENAYVIGHAKIESIVDEIEKNYLLLKQQVWPFSNERYQSIFEQIVSFLASYEPTFFANRCIEDLDYPLLDGIPLQHHMYHKKGCDLVYEYVQRLMIENIFIHRFYKEIPDVVHSYERTKGVSVAILGCSLCEIVYHQYLFHLLVPQSSLLFDEQQHAFVCECVYRMDLKELWKTMNAQMKQEVSYEEYEYLQRGNDNFLRQLEIAKRVRSVEQFVLCDLEDTLTQFTLKAPCNPAIYQGLLKTLEKQMNAPQKASCILQADLGFYDYIDIFEADILQEEDYKQLFTLMQDVQLMSLLAYVAQDIINFHQQITLSEQQLRELPCESTWQHVFYAYLASLSSSRKQGIVDMLERVTISFS